MPVLITREIYIQKIRPFIDKPFIKVITGIRRSGKSAILQILMDELYEKGVSAENIIYINFESMQFADIDTAQKLHLFISEKIKLTQRYYILLDEIQEVDKWEKAVNSFLVDFDCDVYITGSNSTLLSGELATYIAGRYLEINILPLSFGEFLDFRKELGEDITDPKARFVDYLRSGGFPSIHIFNYSAEQGDKIVSDIFASAMLRDVINRNKIRNTDLMEKIIKFIFDNIGNTFSAKKVADYFKSQHRKVDIETIFNYLSALENAFIIYKIPRFDLKGKEILQTNEKYFIADMGLKNALLGYHDRDISGSLENMVFLELKRRGYTVYIGKLGTMEIDFIARRKDQKLYVQVAYKLPEKSTVDREFKSLLEVKDNFPKYVVTMEEFWQDNIEGVLHKNIADFLLSDEY